MKAPRKATVNWNGTMIRGEELRELPDGSWMMIALEKHPRFNAGHEFLALAHEIKWDDEA